jgi:hypothetical protein
MWRVVPSVAVISKCAAVPLASALLSVHEPLSALEPDEAAAIQSDGRLSVAKTVPVALAATLAGTEPVLIFRIALTPIAVSIASSRAFRTAAESWIAISYCPS